MAQGTLGTAGVRRVWAGAGLQRAAYRGGGILRGFPHSLFNLRKYVLSNTAIDKDKPSMISCLACEISRCTSLSISRLSVSRSATVTDGDDDVSDDRCCCCCGAVAVDDELLVFDNEKQKPNDS